MAEDSSNHDEGFGLPPAPTIAPEFSAESKSPHNSISSAAASTEGGDDTNIPSVTGDRKKKRDNPQGKGKAKVKNSSSPVSAPTDDSRSGSSRVKGEQSQ
ncbi:hypothetical protein NW754_001208 [Fusarium falciforme]|nr:hypothetical protein NW754_001208 [Fusarium falciforme]